MVETLIFYAHPKREGHNAALLAAVQQELQAAKQEYQLIDLYQDSFDPILHPNEHYTSGGYDKSDQVVHYQDLIANASRLIFIYPVWWGAMPAVLKGFFDKVLTPRFAYRYKKLPFPIFGLRARPIGLLKGKKAVVFLTVGSPRWAQFLVMRDNAQFIARKGILEFCGVRTKTRTLANCGVPLDDHKKAQASHLVRRGLRWLYR